MTLTDAARSLLIKRGSDEDFGARPLRRAIESNVENPLAEDILRGKFRGMDQISIETEMRGDKEDFVFIGSKSE